MIDDSVLTWARRIGDTADYLVNLERDMKTLRASHERLRKAAEAFRLKIEQMAVPIALARKQGVRWDVEEMELKYALADVAMSIRENP
jgi:PAS domain-containing protein